MPSIDMPLEQMRQYKPTTYREADFDSFWQRTCDDAISQPLNAELIPYVLPARNLECFAVRFDGFGGGRIAGWYVRPISDRKCPGVVLYHGYSRRGERPLEMISYASQGLCVLSMDTRGQNGQSQDASVADEGHQQGWLTKGIRDPRKYYYRYVYADALRAFELLARRDEVDASRLAVSGSSQGGALALAVAALSDRPILAMADFPFLCDFHRAVEIASAPPYPEIAGFIKAFPHLYDQAFRTLSYFDVVNLASRIRCRTLVSNCLWDDICPPSTVFAAYNHITSEKQIELYPFHKHELPYEHTELKFRTLIETLDV